MKEICLFQHAGSKNHGCEALVRSTIKCCDSISKNFFLITTCKEEDEKYNLDKKNIKIYNQRNLRKKELSYLWYALKYRLFDKSVSSFNACTWQFEDQHKDYIALAIGGDNYCYDLEWFIKDLIQSHKWFKKHKKKTVLWGCSIEEKSLQDKRRLKDIKRYDLITVRESMSKEVLEKYGVTKNVILSCDSAFFLDVEDVLLPEKFLDNNTVGINLSPIVLGGDKGKIVLEAYENMIEYIINYTDMNIALIPHVVQAENDDRETNHILFEKYKNTGRILEIMDCNCMELKGVIAKCRFFVGARTHATIAAYSSYVPTLVVGYSIKSKGIARDLFGSYENYVVSAHNLNNKEELTEKFKYIIDNEDNIKNRLQNVVPSHKERMKEAVLQLRNLE